MKLQIIKDKIITVQGQQVILDSDIADLYKVETKRVVRETHTANLSGSFIKGKIAFCVEIL